VTRCPQAGALAVAAACLCAAAAVQAQEVGPFAGCIGALRAALPRHAEVRAETFDGYTRDAQDLRPVIRAATESQPEFRLPVWDYLARLVDSQRIADGKEVLSTQAGPLQAISARHGVDAATAVAVFGVETDYGRVGGRYRVVDATLSRACLDLKSRERERHFFAALWLLQEGLVQPDNFRGSWAGAFGMTQFMPGTFVAYMDKGEGSGPVDIVGSAADGLATTARYIASLGWSAGLRWGVEVTPPQGAARELIAAERDHGCLSAADLGGKCRTVEQWAALGVSALGASTDAGPPPALPPGTRAALLAPGGADGPAWLVTRNYQAVWQYNRADTYGLAIGLLSDALRGDPPMRTAWPTDDVGLSRPDMRALQQRLLALGHADVVVDGYDGPRTQEAIRAEERRLGWSETGRAGAKIARALKETPEAGTPAQPAEKPNEVGVPETAAPASPAAPAVPSTPAPAPAPAPAAPQAPLVPAAPIPPTAPEPPNAPASAPESPAPTTPVPAPPGPVQAPEVPASAPEPAQVPVAPESSVVPAAPVAPAAPAPPASSAER
jgi:lytic murein transglycosylase